MVFRSKLFYVYMCCVLLYAASFFTPRSISTIQTYELSTIQYYLLSLSVALPLSLIWFAAFYGYGKLRAYSQTIHGTPDGKHMARITTGIMVLAFGLPLSSLLGSAIAIAVQQNPDLQAAGSVIRNYVSMLYPLVGFVFISRGARGLSDLAKQRPSYLATNALGAIFIAISVLYCYIVATSQNINEIYHLPGWLVLSSLVAPYLFTWYIGLSSAFEIHSYSRTAPGVLYRKTWNMLATGIGAIIIMQIVVQYITTLTVQLANLRLLRLLIIVYILLALLAVGYVLVALGAKRLQKIEEV